MDQSQCIYFDPFSVAWFIGEQSYEFLGIVILWILFSNSNELKGIWNILFNESRLEQICRALRQGAMSSNIKKTVLLFIRMISIDI